MAEHLVYKLPRLPAINALEILADFLGSDKDGALAERTAVELSKDLKAHISFRSNNTRLSSKADEKHEGKLFSAYNNCEYNRQRGSELPADLPDPLSKKDEKFAIISDVTQLIAGVLANGSVLGSMTDTHASMLAEPIEKMLFVIGNTDDSNQLAKSLTQIEWRSTGMNVTAFGLDSLSGTNSNSEQDDVQMAIACIGIDPDWGATQDIIARHQELYEDNVELFEGYRVARGFLLLKQGIKLEVTTRELIAKLLPSVLAASGKSENFVLVVDWEMAQGRIGSARAMLAEFPDEGLPGEPTIVTAQGQDRDGLALALDVEYVALKKMDNATKDLRERLELNASNIGHRISLQPIPHYIDSEEDRDEIEQQIEELSIRRDIILGEGMGDWRLLRFPANGLNAMIDYLRKFKMETLDAGVVKYAYRASGEEPRGAHYLLYRLRDVLIAPAYPEAYWRKIVGSGTIEHRVDPLFAQFAASRKARSLVFTPKQTVLVPSFSVTQEDVDTYLKQGFGSLMGLEDAFEEAGAESANEQPIYLFGNTEDHRIRVEIMDGATFQPVKRVVPFLNDNLEVARRIDIEEFITNAADGLWRQERLSALERSSLELTEKLESQIKQIENGLAEKSRSLIDALCDEVDAIRAHVENLTSLMEETSERATLIEESATRGLRSAASLESSADDLPIKFSELVSRRHMLSTKIEEKKQEARDYTDTAVAGLTSIRQDIKRLKEEIKGD
ncbi:MAG: hypothetical protein ABJO86_13155 [Lentilitoribacter sp.]